MHAPDAHDRLVQEYEHLYEDCNFSALTYFNAAKSAALWGKAIVFWSAVAGAAASLLVSVGQSRQWGSIGAVASTVAATASFLGTGARAGSLKESASSLTTLRHRVRVELALAEGRGNETLEQILRDLRSEYASIVSTNELVSDRFFRKSQRQMRKQVLKYDNDAAVEHEIGTERRDSQAAAGQNA